MPKRRHGKLHGRRLPGGRRAATTAAPPGTLDRLAGDELQRMVGPQVRRGQDLPAGHVLPQVQGQVDEPADQRPGASADAL